MLAAGFTDAALGPQAVFRCLLDALAAPGRILTLPDDVPAAPEGMGAGVYAATLALVDFESPLWLAPELAGAAETLRFHTGASIVARPDVAAFALASDAARVPALEDFAQGTDAYPDRSTTLLLEVRGLSGDGAWLLRGPGIETSRRLGVDGLPFDFIGQWAENRERFPRGVDVFLFDGARVVGLPRTTRIVEG